MYLGIEGSPVVLVAESLVGVGVRAGGGEGEGIDGDGERDFDAVDSLLSASLYDITARCG